MVRGLKQRDYVCRIRYEIQMESRAGDFLGFQREERCFTKYKMAGNLKVSATGYSLSEPLIRCRKVVSRLLHMYLLAAKTGLHRGLQ